MKVWFLVLTLSTGWEANSDDLAMKQFVTIAMPDETTCLRTLNLYVYTESRQRADEFQDEIIIPHKVEDKTCKEVEVVAQEQGAMRKGPAHLGK